MTKVSMILNGIPGKTQLLSRNYLLSNFIHPPGEVERKMPCGRMIIMTRVKWRMDKEREEMMIPTHRIKSMKEKWSL